MRNVVAVLLLAVQVLIIVQLLWHRSRKKNAEAQLIRSGERLRLAMQTGKSVGWDWDIASGRDFWFGDLRSFFGIPSDTHTASVHEFFNYVHPEDRQRLAEAVADARQSHKLYSTEFRISSQDRPTRWVAARGEFQYAADGTATRMLGLAVDVTENKRVEEALKKSEEKYSKAFRESPLIVTLTSVKEDRFVEVNDTHEQITGWARDEVIGRTPIEVGIWIDIGQRADFVKQVAAGATLRNYEFGFRNRAGADRIGLLSADLIDINGETCILSVTADITERKAAYAALRESEERFRLVAQSAPVAIWMSDVNNACVYVNQRWIDLTGRSFEAHLGSGWAENMHPEDLEGSMENVRKAFDLHGPFRVECRVRRHDGEYVWVLVSAAPRFNTDGSFAGYIGSAVDINEIKLAERVLSTMSQRLIEAHETERAWIAGELHDDIGQRLVLVALNLGNLETALPESLPALSKDLKQARQQLERLGNDIQSLSHNLHPSKARHLGLAKAAANFCSELSAKNVEIDFQSENMPPDLAEPVSLCLYRVLQEALQNAVKHSGSRRFQVVLSGGSNEIHLSVHDSGIGFDPALAMKGQGIGLNSMKERLKLVNGSLSIDSQPSRGTTVHARVPLTPRQKSRAIGG